MDRNVELPSIELVARCIGDPVIRLRFLKAVAPAPPKDSESPTHKGFFHYLLLAIVPLTLIAALLVVRAAARIGPLETRNPPAVSSQSLPPPAVPEVWMVEKNASEEVFSNGLHIDTRFAVSNHARSYLAFPANSPSGGRHVRRSTPAGIVFHTTESLQIPFEARQNGALKRIGESLLEYVGRKCAYNYVIDRFGRVFRVVAEQEAANHAGYSVWADDQWLYLNLNESFLGVSFEASTGGGKVEATLNPAQISSAAMLTELLRGRYQIPAANCVTHMQVSVNPDNMLVGYHTDWASGFPFEQVGLPDNYSLPPSSLATFGFLCGQGTRQAADPRLAVAIQRAEAVVTQPAGDAGMGVPAYRRTLQRRYLTLLADVKTAQGEASRASVDTGQSERPSEGR